MLRPGVDRIKSLGGLHEFMNCNLPILTDSGGFQVMSLSKLNKIDSEKGAIFQSHIDGKKFILSPEESIKLQKKLNSDIVMVMDECPKNSNDYDPARWIDRNRRILEKYQALVRSAITLDALLDSEQIENNQYINFPQIE